MCGPFALPWKPAKRQQNKKGWRGHRGQTTSPGRFLFPKLPPVLASALLSGGLSLAIIPLAIGAKQSTRSNGPLESHFIGSCDLTKHRPSPLFQELLCAQRTTTTTAGQVGETSRVLVCRVKLSSWTDNGSDARQLHVGRFPPSRLLFTRPGNTNLLNCNRR